VKQLQGKISNIFCCLGIIRLRTLKHDPLPIARFEDQFVRKRLFIKKDFIRMSKDWVEVFVTYDRIEAEIVKDLLESGGIPVIIRSAKVTPYPVNIGKMGEVKVLVRKEDKQTAEEVLIKSYNAGSS
jgi:hypothetical protein